MRLWALSIGESARRRSVGNLSKVESTRKVQIKAWIVETLHLMLHNNIAIFVYYIYLNIDSSCIQIEQSMYKNNTTNKEEI